MISYLRQIVNIKFYLILANILLVFFLILLNKLGVLPIQNLGNFLFFVFLLLILALYRPGWTFLFFVGTIAIENVNVAPADLAINVRPYQLLAALTIVSIIVRFVAKRMNFELPKWKIWDLAPIIFVLGGFLSALFSDNKAGSFKISIIAFSFAAIYFLVRIFVQDLGDLKKIIPFFLSSSLVVMIYGIWQNVRFMRGLNSFEVMPGRVNATFTEPDWYGVFVVFAIVSIYAIIYYFSKSCERSEEELKMQISKCKMTIKNFKFYTSHFYIALAFIVLILTVSRSAWLGMLIVSIIYIIFSFWQYVIKNKKYEFFLRQLIFLAAAGIISVAVVYFFNLTSFQLFNRFQSTGTGLQQITVTCRENIVLPEKINTSEELIQYDCRHINLEEINLEKMRGNYIKEIYRNDPNVDIRSSIYQLSWQQIKKNPLFGIGWGSIGPILGQDERGTAFNSSNIFLEVWLGSGFIGFASFVVFWAYIICAAISELIKYRNGNSEIAMTTALFVVLAWLGLTTANLFNAGIFMGILWLYLGITQVTDENRN